jgi:hypothetical protein
MVRRLAQFAPHSEARNGAEIASTGLACLLVLALFRIRACEANCKIIAEPVLGGLHHVYKHAA